MKRIGLLVGIVSLLTCQLSEVIACGPNIPEKQVSFLASNLVKHPYFELFENFHIRGKTLAEQHSENLLDWQQFFQQHGIASIPLTDLADLIYTSSAVQLRYMLYESTHAQPEGSKKTRFFSMVYPLAQHTLRTVIDYLLFAKECELISQRQMGRRWDNYGRNQHAVPLETLIEQGKEAYKNSHSDFFKMRYGYQLVKLALYLEAFDECATSYDTFVEPLQIQSPLRYWALEYKAGALLRMGRRAEALYLFAMVFEHSSKRRSRAYQGFNIANLGKECWEESLTFAHNEHEQSMMWALWTYRNGFRYSVEPLRQFYDLFPNSPLLGSMMVSQIRAFEQRVFSKYMRQLFSEKTEEVDIITYLAEFKQFVLECLESSNIRQPALWYMIAGYLSFMESLESTEHDEVFSFLDKAETAAIQEYNQNILQQVHLIRNLSTLYHTQTLDQALSHSFYPQLQWLTAREEQTVMQSVLIALAQKYLLQNDVVRAICCMAKAPEPTVTKVLLDMYATEDDLEQLTMWLTDMPYSSFDRFLMEDFPFTLPEILDLRGTRLLRQRRIHEAFLLFQRIPKEYWQNTEPYTYTYRWKPEHQRKFRTSFFDNPYEPSDKFEIINKLQFTHKLIELELQAQRTPGRAADCYWQIANAFFHTPYWGYSEMLWRGNLIMQLTYYYRPRRYPLQIKTIAEHMKRSEQTFRQEYGTRVIARHYYQKTIETTADDELAAQATALAQLCMNTRLASLPLLKGPWQHDDHYLYLLHESYSHTQFYQELIQECSTLKEFVNHL